jgi:DNA/RNA-binding domain of Phe-tRNA-synthetase-like protein
MHRVQINPAVLQRFPHYRLLVVYAKGLTNSPSTEYSLEQLRKAEGVARAAFTSQKPSEHPHIVAWREAYGNFGLKPSKFLCSAEALISRTVKGNDLPAINALVDLYNAVSVRHVIPVGGENWDNLESDLVLKFADGSEPFDTFKDGQPVVEHPQAGEVVWADSAGVTCRAWNWRQCIRTRLTETTVNAYFILDSLEPFSEAQLEAAGDELISYLRQVSPNCQVEAELFGSS